MLGITSDKPDSRTFAFSEIPESKVTSEPLPRVARLSHNNLRGTIFHESWWLDAVTGGAWDEVSVEADGRTVGILRFVKPDALIFRQSGQPPFTHLLGPVLDLGKGKPITQLRREIDIVGTLLDQLPPMECFEQTLPATTTNVLAYQQRGFAVRVQHTLAFPKAGDGALIWAGLRDKTRNLIRRAKEKYVVKKMENPALFSTFYKENIEKAGGFCNIDFRIFAELYAICRQKNRGVIRAAYDDKGEVVAANFTVWDDQVMYYLMSSRSKDLSDPGAASLLLWEAIEDSLSLGLAFDFDGIINQGGLQFLSGFCHDLSVRFMVTRQTTAFKVWQKLKGLAPASSKKQMSYFIR
jgi:hypothetical protein